MTESSTPTSPQPTPSDHPAGESPENAQSKTGGRRFPWHRRRDKPGSAGAIPEGGKVEHEPPATAVRLDDQPDTEQVATRGAYDDDAGEAAGAIKREASSDGTTDEHTGSKDTAPTVSTTESGGARLSGSSPHAQARNSDPGRSSFSHTKTSARPPHPMSVLAERSDEGRLTPTSTRSDPIPIQLQIGHPEELEPPAHADEPEPARSSKLRAFGEWLKGFGHKDQRRHEDKPREGSISSNASGRRDSNLPPHGEAVLDSRFAASTVQQPPTRSGEHQAEYTSTPVHDSHLLPPPPRRALYDDEQEDVRSLRTRRSHNSFQSGKSYWSAHVPQSPTADLPTPPLPDGWKYAWIPHQVQVEKTIPGLNIYMPNRRQTFYKTEWEKALRSQHEPRASGLEKCPAGHEDDPKTILTCTQQDVVRPYQHPREDALPPHRSRTVPVHLCRIEEVQVQRSHHQQRSSKDDTVTGIVERHSKSLDLADERALRRPFSDCSNTAPLATSDSGSGTSPDSDSEEEHETPLTSPCTSPIKHRPVHLRREPWKRGIVQVDGPKESSEEDGEHTDPTSRYQTVKGQEQHEIPNSADLSYTSDATVLGERNASHRRYFSTVERQSERASELDTFETAIQTYGSVQEDDEATPLVTPSPAKGATSFPFPRKHTASMPERVLSRIRRPSTLLQQCERVATPRQRQLLNSGARTPDRFIPLRAATPNKDSLYLSAPAPKLSVSRKQHGRRSPPLDPFDPTPRRSLRFAEQYATIRSPPPPTRQAGLRSTRVPQAESPARRSASADAVWSVGGTTTTEGVASVTNGRGGRLTSGTNAPHYAADFLRRHTPSAEEVTHGRRLAFAMDIDQSARMLDHSLPSSPASSGSPSSDRKGGHIWRDGGWEHKTSPLTPTKVRAKTRKDIPVIPFRVLNAPALRDDFYCSLLAHSSTLNCLAVGLGAQVYLWTEKRDRGSNIPDSLTVPLGSSHVTSLSFSSVGGNSAILAIGRADGRITLWSPLDREPRFDSEQPSPVSCVCFRPSTVQRRSVRDSIATVATEELLVGDEAGFVYYYAIEWPSQNQRDLFDWHGSMTLLARISCHSQQICGLAWSPDGAFFATGGNDNQMFLFETKKILKRQAGLSNYHSVRVRGPSTFRSSTAVAGQREVISLGPGSEKHTFTLNAAVKAIAFAPWQPTLLAAGGGSNDRCIHFFHTLSGATLATIDCHAQVTSLVWSSRRKEIAATFGFAQPEDPHRVAVFAWPSCELVVKIPWFTEERALYAVAYPKGPSHGGDGEASGGHDDQEGRPWYGRRTREEGCLVVATSDASIKFHEIWAERREGGGKRVDRGPLGGSRILEGECSEEMGRGEIIR